MHVDGIHITNRRCVKAHGIKLNGSEVQLSPSYDIYLLMHDTFISLEINYTTGLLHLDKAMPCETVCMKLMDLDHPTCYPYQRYYERIGPGVSMQFYFEEENK